MSIFHKHEEIKINVILYVPSLGDGASDAVRRLINHHMNSSTSD